MMKWTKPSASTIDYFERIAPGPPIEARRMFGMPSRFLNGHMLVSVFGNSLMLHLSETDRLECIAAGARPFAPMGRSAEEYVEIDIGHFEDQTLKEWIVRGMRYLGSLPPKLGKPAREERAAESGTVTKGAQAKPMKAKPAKAKPAKAKPAKAKPAKATRAKAKPLKAKAKAKAKPAKPVKAKPTAKPTAKKRVPQRGAKQAARATKATPRRTPSAKKSPAKKRR